MLSRDTSANSESASWLSPRFSLHSFNRGNLTFTSLSDLCRLLYLTKVCHMCQVYVRKKSTLRVSLAAGIYSERSAKPQYLCTGMGRRDIRPARESMLSVLQS